jgi:hypothetical protein
VARWWIITLVALLLGVSSLWKCVSARSLSTPRAFEELRERSSIDARSSAATRACAHPALPRNATVVLTGSPREPGEDFNAYQNRVALFHSFESFRKMSAISDAQAQYILLALYDHQRNTDALIASMTANAAESLDDQTWLRVVEENANAVFHRLEATLTREQLALWHELCRPCVTYASWGALRLEHW